MSGPRLLPDWLVGVPLATLQLVLLVIFVDRREVFASILPVTLISAMANDSFSMLRRPADDDPHDDAYWRLFGLGVANVVLVLSGFVAVVAIAAIRWETRPAPAQELWIGTEHLITAAVALGHFRTKQAVS